jgi:hypothetical protein
VGICADPPCIPPDRAFAAGAFDGPYGLPDMFPFFLFRN